MSFKFGTNQSPGSNEAMFFQYVFNCSASRIPDKSQIDIDLIFGTTADKSYHDLVIQNGKTSPIMNSTSPQSKGFGSSYMANTWWRGII